MNNNQNQNQAPQQPNVAPQQQQNVQNQQPQQQGQQQQVNQAPVQQVQFNVPPPIVKKTLSKWGIEGLDLSDPGFSKLHSKESKYSDNKAKYNLEPEKFENYKRNWYRKSTECTLLNAWPQ